ncbi:MAG: L,D-transpeptidase family protein [Chitinophagaceae bacterium]|nr:L,D-transpeptidase family protein [Chitinophagaceae bacterium]
MRYLQHPNSQQLLFVIIFLFLAACNNSTEEKQTEIIETPEKMDDAIVRNIQSFISQADDNTGRLYDSVRLKSFASVKEFYQTNNYKNTWSASENYIPVADSLFRFIEQAKLYGLFPEDYHFNHLSAINRAFAADTAAVDARRNAVLWTKADILLTDAFVTIAKHLHKGRLHPDSIYKNFDSTLGYSYYHQFLKQAIETGSVTRVLAKLEPKHRAYRELKRAIKPFLDSADFSTQYTWLVYPYKDSSAFVKSLIKRLKEDGTLDSSVTRLDSPSLKSVIIKVQKERRLTVDGKFGAQLVNSLNNSDAEKFRRIAINLDRYKLMPDSMPKRYIWVNLPSFYMQVMEEDTVALESRVVVGKPKTRTPLLTSQLSDMVTYPQWTIPNSIIVKEILPALKKNPGYLAHKGFNLVTWDGDEVNPYAVDWAKYSKGIPYKVVQGSGDANALGVMKFNFPNKYSVYLHDTNQRYLFKNENRSLSHGCVRVQEWEKLVWYIYGLDSIAAEKVNAKYLPSDSIRTWLSHKERHVIPVKTKIPVYFRYFTAAGKNGKLILYSDIYGEDRIAREAYFSNK